MPVIRTADLNELLAAQDGHKVSLYMPTHRAGAEIRQDPIRFRNLLDVAEERLTAAGLRSPEAAGLLEPARDLAEDQAFWRRQSDGLALFVASEFFRVFRVPRSFEELVIADSRFHVLPLLPLFVMNERYFVLALSQKNVRLFEVARCSIRELHAEQLPKGLGEVLERTDFEDAATFHATGPSSTTGGQATSKFHALGESKDDYIKDEIRQFLVRLNHALTDFLGDETAPLVLVGLEELQGPYRKLNTYRPLLDTGVMHNPDALSLDELHNQTFKLVEPYFQQDRQAAAERYQALAAGGDSRASADIGIVLPAAADGRVDTLFVATDQHRWGTFDPEKRTVAFQDETAPGAEDLLDRVAIETIRHSGAVYAVPSADVPSDDALAAIFRY